jgi:glyoxylase-like metal-dependent hydrolase (beta-lactamase superfamily II)
MAQATQEETTMLLPKRRLRKPAVSMFLVAGVLWAFLLAVPLRAQMPGSTSPVLPENAVKRVSDHVYVIRGFPNVEIVVGNRATLIVDTGLGARNGTIVLHEAQKLTKPNMNLYLTTTHFHPEHAGGAQAFPASTVLIRPVAQQEEMDQHGAEFIERFRNMSAINKELLQDVTLRPADIVFEHEAKVDLGGVTAHEGRRANSRRAR